MKKIFLLIVLILLKGCGYTSVYKNQEQNLKILVNNMKGDFEINNFIKNDLKIASKENSENVFEVSFETKYDKTTLAKDSAGKATDYRLNLIVKFIINSEQNQEITFKEDFKIKSNDENFEQSNYEKEIKRNFSKLIKDKLVLFLLKTYDN